MSYMALYRKFRPTEFSDVRGQDHIVTTLKNQINADRIGHAYLFCGTRGTGKTTVAKIFARAVQMQRSDYDKYDYIIGMDSWNRRNMMRILGKDPEGKVSLLLDYTDHPRDIADPWYTGNFDATYDDVKAGCEALLTHIQETEGRK